MIDQHAPHRPYLAALADGELELVPQATREHVEGCRECTFELQTHQLLATKLRAAAGSAAAAVPAVPLQGRRRRYFLPAAAAAALVLVAVGAQLTLRSGPDPLASAVQVANREPDFWSANPSDIASWCTARYGNRVPAVALPGLVPVGARMDWPNGIGVATVSYEIGGKAVHVSWLNSSIGGSAPAEMTVNGHEAVVVRAHGITAVVTGAASDSQLEAVAREIAAGE